MTNLLFFKIEHNLRLQIENFSASSSIQNINFQSTDNINDFKSLYGKNHFDLIIMDCGQDKNEIIDFLKKTPATLSKFIIFSPNKNDAFEFINFNVFGFLAYPLETVSTLTAINRCLNQITIEKEANQLKLPKKKFQNFVSVNSIKKIELIKTDNISYFEADGRYTIIYLTNGVSKMASKNLGEYQKILNPDVFCRIHHKFIINMNSLLNILKSDGFYCEMLNNKNVPVSKRKLENLNSILNLDKTLVEI